MNLWVNKDTFDVNEKNNVCVYGREREAGEGEERGKEREKGMRRREEKRRRKRGGEVEEEEIEREK